MKEQLYQIAEKEIDAFHREESGKQSLKQTNFKKVRDIVADPELRILFRKFEKETFDYSNLVEISDIFSKKTEQIKVLKEEIDLDEFFSTGQILNFKKLRKIFLKQKYDEKFPKFNFDRYEELIKNPVLELENFRHQKIKFDKHLVRKLMIGINQMIFSEMDLRIINAGKEGAGKSLFSSQLIFYLYWFLKEVGLITYEYNVKKLFYSSLGTMLEDQDVQKDEDYFRIFCLDEGYELNRQNFREELSKSYKDGMRSSRKLLRIEITNLPQLGELETAITLTRTNFIFITDMDSEPETGTVKKGEVYFYIIPRGKLIYSPFQRRNISDEEIVNDISKVMKDKNDSYKGLPKNCLINKFHFEGIWGFNKEAYDAHIKAENRKRRLSNSVGLSQNVAWILYKKLPKVANWGTFDLKNTTDKKMYNTFKAWYKKKLEWYFLNNPEAEKRNQRIYGDEE
jgi:hypothetical protein